MGGRKIQAWGVALAVPAALLILGAPAEPAAAKAPKCAGKRATIVGTKGRDVIRGTRRADVIVARGGDDTVRGRGGKDRICGGGGDDLLIGGAAKDLHSGGAGTDACVSRRSDARDRGCEPRVVAFVPDHPVEGGLDGSAQLRLDRRATRTISVAISSADAERVIVPSSVAIAPGEDSAPVVFATTHGPPARVLLRARFGRSHAGEKVTLRDDHAQLIGLERVRECVRTGEVDVHAADVKLDRGADALGGAVVTIESSDPFALHAPADVHVLPGQAEAPVLVTGLNPGPATITAIHGPDELTLSMPVIPAEQPECDAPGG